MVDEILQSVVGAGWTVDEILLSVVVGGSGLIVDEILQSVVGDGWTVDEFLSSGVVEGGIMLGDTRAEHRLPFIFGGGFGMLTGLN